MSSRRFCARMIGTFNACQRPFKDMVLRQCDTALYMRGSRMTTLTNIALHSPHIIVTYRNGSPYYSRGPMRVSGAWIEPGSDTPSRPTQPGDANLVDARDLVRW